MRLGANRMWQPTLHATCSCLVPSNLILFLVLIRFHFPKLLFPLLLLLLLVKPSFQIWSLLRLPGSTWHKHSFTHPLIHTLHYIKVKKYLKGEKNEFSNLHRQILTQIFLTDFGFCSSLSVFFSSSILHRHSSSRVFCFLFIQYISFVVIDFFFYFLKFVSSLNIFTVFYLFTC